MRGGGEGGSEVKGKSAKAEHRKELLDPLHEMRHYITAKKKSAGEGEGEGGGGGSSAQVSWGRSEGCTSRLMCTRFSPPVAGGTRTCMYMWLYYCNSQYCVINVTQCQVLFCMYVCSKCMYIILS